MTWFIFKSYRFLHSPITEKEDGELYFAILLFKEFGFTLTPFCPAVPNTANWCKETITPQFGLFCKGPVQHKWYLSTAPSLHCVKIHVKSRPSAPQPHPQAAPRIPAYPIPVTFFYPIESKLPQATWAEGHRSQILLDPLLLAFCIKFSKTLGNLNPKFYPNILWYVVHWMCGSHCSVFVKRKAGEVPGEGAKVVVVKQNRKYPGWKDESGKRGREKQGMRLKSEITQGDWVGG